MSDNWRAYKDRCWGQPVPAHLKHGPATAAMKAYGCDCKLCLPSGRRTWRNNGTEATGPKDARTRNAELRARKKGTPVPAGTKHGIYTYRVYGCRCPICKAAELANVRRRDHAWRDRAHGRWTTDGDREIVCWPPKNAGPDWVCPDCNSSSPNHQEVA